MIYTTLNKIEEMEKDAEVFTYDYDYDAEVKKTESMILEGLSWTALLLVAIILATLTGCGGDTGPPEDSSILPIGCLSQGCAK